MGGLGRTINGSYAEYTRAPVTNVAAIESGLSWADLAAIPESYATAWTCLFRNLEVARARRWSSGGRPRPSARRRSTWRSTPGRTSSPPPAAGTGSRWWRRSAVRAEVEGPDLSKRIAEAGEDRCRARPGRQQHHPRFPRDASPGGRACLAGWLGGLAPIADFNHWPQMASGVYLTFFALSFSASGEAGLPTVDVPLQTIAADVEAGR